MLRFSRKQEVFKIGRVQVGGQPGELPTVLIGSIFYHGHKIVEDPKLGGFDRGKAEELVNKQDELSDATGNPCMVDAVAVTPEAMVKYLEYCVDATEAPILIDGVPKARVAGVKYALEAGFVDRVVYNSIFMPSREELSNLQKAGIKAAILLAYNPKNPWARGRLEMVEQLFDKAREASVEKPLVDVCVINLPSFGLALRAAYMVKEKYGVPVGCAPSNGIHMWREGSSIWGKEILKLCNASASAIALTSCCDYVLYGPIEEAPNVFPVCAVADAVVATAVREMGITTKTRDHPLYKLFPRFVQELKKYV